MSDTAPLKTTFLAQLRSSFAQPTGPAVVPPAASSVAGSSVSTQTQLDVLDSVLGEVEQQAAQVAPAAWPLAVSQATDTLNPAVPVATAKEAIERNTSPEQSKVDIGGGMQMVELEPNPEIPVEVESYLQHVEDHQDQLPQEIVVTGDTAQLVQQAPSLRPVIVLPISPQVEAAGAKKSSKWSVRWLVEWSRRLMKMFSGKIVYADS